MQSIWEYRTLVRFLIRNHKPLFYVFLPISYSLCVLLKENIENLDDPNKAFVTAALAADFTEGEIETFKNILVEKNYLPVEDTDNLEAYFLEYATLSASLNSSLTQKILVSSLIAHLEESYVDTTLEPGMNFEAIFYLFLSYIAFDNSLPVGAITTELLEFVGIPVPGLAIITSEMSGSGAIADETKFSEFVSEGSTKAFAEVTFLAGGSITQGTWLKFTSVSGASFAFWLDIDADGTEPTDPDYVSANQKFEIDIDGSDTAAQVTDIILTALTGHPAWVAFDYTATEISPEVLKFQSESYGSGAEFDHTGQFANGWEVGRNSKLNSKYFTFSTTESDYYVWYNVNAGGSDPAIGGATGIEVELSLEDSIETVVAASYTAVKALIETANEEATVASDSVTFVITQVLGGPVPLAADGNIGNGFAISNLSSGEFSPAFSEMVQTAYGEAPLEFSITGGALPGGFTIDAETGEVSGQTSSLGGEYTFTVTVTDAGDGNAVQEIILTLS